MSSSWVKDNKTLVLSGVITLVIVVLVAIYIWRHGVDKDENGPGSIESAVVVQGDDGRSSLVLIESVEHSDDTSGFLKWRYTKIDPVFGKFVQRAPLLPAESDRKFQCEGATYSVRRPSRAWCKRDGHLELRDISTMAVVADEAKLGKGVGIMTDRAMIIDREKSEIEVQTKDGYFLTINADNLSTQKLEKSGEVANRAASRIALGGPLSRHADCSGAELSETDALDVNGPGARVKISLKRGIGQPATPLGTETYLRPSILCDGNKAILLPSDDPKGPRTFVIAEKTSLDDAQSKTRLIAMDETGKQRWDAKIDHRGSLMLAEVINNHVLIIVIGGKPGAVFGFDTKSGQQSFVYDGVRR